MAKVETLRVRVRAKWLPDKSAKEGDELDLPNAEAHSLERRGYVEILWQGTEAKDMGTEPDAETQTGLPKYVKPEEKKVAPIVKPAASKTVIKKSPPPKSKPKTGKK